METSLCQNETTNLPLTMSANPTGNVKNDSTIIISNQNEREKETPTIIKTGRVYIITNLINNKKYVGITTKSIEERFKEHTWESNKNGFMVICDAIKKYGKENFKIELIEELQNVTEDELLSRETFYIDKYNTLIDNGCGYNMVRCHKGRLIFSEETKRKMSLNHADINGDKNPFYGKHHTEETLKKHSEWKKKYKSGKNHPMYGTSRPDNTKKKISLSLSDTTMKHFRNICNNEEFIGIRNNFVKKYNLNRQCVNNLISRQRKSLCGWVLVNDA
jgi:group I intron endonuclease